MEFKLSNTKKITPTAENTEWYFSDGTVIKGLSATKSFDQAGNYQVQAKCGDLWSLARKITIDDLPVVKMPDDQLIDLGQTIKLIPAVSNPFNVPIAFDWDLGDGEKAEGLSVEHGYKQAGEFTAVFRVWYKNVGFGQSKDYSIKIKVLPAPEVEIKVSPDELYVGGARDAVSFEAVPKSY